MPTIAKLFFGAARLGGVEDSQWDVLNATGGFDDVSLSWPTAGNSPSSYEIEIDGTIVDVGNVTSYNAAALSIGQTYRFKVRPKYSDGSVGGWSFFKDRSPAGPNIATGGTITDITDYNGTGQTWRIHKFTSNGTFSVTQASNSFKTLIVGAGGGGGGGNGGHGGEKGGGSGGGGNAILNESQTLSVRSYSISIGSGGGGGAGSGGTNGGNGGDGGATTLQDIATANGGGRGGGAYSGNSGWSGASGNGNSGAPINNNGRGGGVIANYGTSPNGLVSNIEGSNKMYGAGGKASSGTLGNGNGGGGGGSYRTGQSGQSGAVIIAYRIA